MVVDSAGLFYSIIIDIHSGIARILVRQIEKNWEIAHVKSNANRGNQVSVHFRFALRGSMVSSFVRLVCSFVCSGREMRMNVQSVSSI